MTALSKPICSAEEVVQDVANLVCPPDVWLRINEVVRDPTASAADIADVVQRDPALTATLLKIVNSAFYQFQNKIDTVSRAVAVIGINDLFSLVTAITAAKVFTNLPNQLVRPETFWRHSVFTGTVSRRVAKECRVLHPERLYVAGMLHDIGSLVLYAKFPEQAMECLLMAEGDEEALCGAETEMFGFTHAELGACLMASWNLPDTLVDTIRWHHLPSHAGGNCLDASIVHLANVIANRDAQSAFMAAGADADIEPDEEIWQVVKLEPTRVYALAAASSDEFEAAMSVMLPHVAGKT